MLLVSHYVTRSKIHGLGVFTRVPIRAGATVWRHDPMFDVDIPAATLAQFPEDLAQTVLHHAEYLPHLGIFRLGNDGDMFMNHSDDPSLIDRGEEMVAARDLAAGTELTCDYAQVCVLGFENALPPRLEAAA
ncbi:SET domain-containing protein [Rhodobacter capsulatus]|uniref:SET domain-containing protein n=1 Tax=Rhodobacter capsulatus TaxID=1061 RepID=A0A4U1JSL2_RHOCA|nr:SET domain-containing protein [Rhodobacter capsulatus]TKD21956.1 SET domain-containing protein [Rhodobacter capsulatus]